MVRSVPRVVLDTNVLVAALITPAGAGARLLMEFRAGAFELVVSPILLAELHDVLHREKFARYVAGIEVEAYIELIRRDSQAHDDPEPWADPAVIDADEAFLVDLARAAQVDAIVSGDRRLLESSHAVRVVTPAEFLASLEGI